MTRLFNDPSRFADEAIDGFVLRIVGGADDAGLAYEGIHPRSTM